MLDKLPFVLGVKTLPLADILEKLVKKLSLINLHLDEALSLLGAQLILLNGLHHIMDASGSLLRCVIEFLSLQNLMQTPHDCSLDHTHRLVDIVVLNARDERFF